MECQECHIRPATLHFTKIINNQKTEFHVCEHCAKEKGEYYPGLNSFSIQHLLSGLLGFEDSMEQMAQDSFTIQALQCPNCGMTYNQFVKKGKFGCSKCYRTFDSRLDPLLKRVHGGNTKHTGKVPKRAGDHIQTSRELDQLKQQLQQHIEKEEFEEAVKIRDRIRAMGKREE